MARASTDSQKHCIGDIEINRITDIGFYLSMLYVHHVTHIILHILKPFYNFYHVSLKNSVKCRKIVLA